MPADDLAVALAHHQQGRLDEAETIYRRLMREKPAGADPPHLLGLLCLSRGQTAEAVALIGLAASRQPNFAPIQRNLGKALVGAGDHPAAILHFRRAAQLNPDDFEAWEELGRTLAVVGETEEAVTCLRTAIRLNPGSVTALQALAAAGARNVIVPLRTLLRRRDLSENDRIPIGRALATALDAEGHYDEAFAILAMAKAGLRRQQAAAGQTFKADELRAYVDQRIATCTPDLFARAFRRGSDSELPVFVVGMPRSGTTLVERILASHKSVAGIGESHLIGHVAEQLDATARQGRFGDWDIRQFRPLADAHLARLRDRAGDAARIVDKTPDNVFHLGAVGTLFQRARVIICRRDPRDICLSCYFQDFEYPMPYANDLADCATRVTETNRLLAHWLKVLPMRILEVRYETLVANPEPEARRLIAFLGLDWDPACLDFHRMPGVVTSASVWQVRRPVYTSSAGRWRHYERHIEPLLRVFGRD